ncbi:MAG: tRNA uridine-5-carboxymethylaminomethyl(34) synthesis GTPase MnmE [Clostridia bacterium]|nr:tRNA uridine-5-carboxymethylaminomethyl(34) synthesis GTPase MnmE [Clostridia bacterium]
MSATVAAISTPQAAGGLGVIRISGDDAIAVADRLFVPTGPRRLIELPGYRAAHGKLVFAGETVDEVVALVFRAPKSYTGENVVELTCHGGLFVLKKVLRAVLASGAVPAGPGEFTRRAFLNGKLDLTEAEAVMRLIEAQGDAGARAALTQLDGALSKKIAALRSRLVAISAQLGAWVDYPDDEIDELENGRILATLEEVRSGLKQLLDHFDAGAAITQGVETAIIGKPNVGKSALMNLLSGYGKSIVTDIAGTTRDVVEETVRLGSLVLHLADTAGIHDTADLVEQIGVDRAKQRVARAGLVLAVFDMSAPLDAADDAILSLCSGRRTIAVLNKTDLPQRADDARIRAKIACCVPQCAKTGDGLAALEAAAADLLGTADVDTGEAMLSTERQRKDAETALALVAQTMDDLNAGMTLDAVNVSIDGAIEALLSLTGERVSDVVLDEVFASFCVGK